MNTRKGSAVLGIQAKAGKSRSKVQVLKDKLKTLEAEGARIDADHEKAHRAAQALFKKSAEAQRKIRECRVKLAAAGG